MFSNSVTPPNLVAGKLAPPRYITARHAVRIRRLLCCAKPSSPGAGPRAPARAPGHRRLSSAPSWSLTHQPLFLNAPAGFFGKRVSGGTVPEHNATGKAP